MEKIEINWRFLNVIRNKKWSKSIWFEMLFLEKKCILINIEIIVLWKEKLLLFLVNLNCFSCISFFFFGLRCYFIKLVGKSGVDGFLVNIYEDVY